ncbi:MAG: rhomboid family intramembrane serine protease [Proteobacteria bacterium]|nr:MAG: rhomboid family intramembrane serine protease [Pseudomonadota bacterium]
MSSPADRNVDEDQSVEKSGLELVATPITYQQPIDPYRIHYAPPLTETILEPLRPSLPYLEEQALTRKIDPAAALGASLFILLFTIMSIISWSSSKEMLVATQTNVFAQGDWWRLITSPFVHADFLHLASNSMLFLIFATLLNNYYGRWAFPVLSVLGAAATEAIALLTYPANVRLVGASGMVYLMAGMWLVYFARHSSYLKLSHRVMRVIAFVLVVLVPTSFEPQVSYRSHAIGFILGVFIAWMSLPWIKPKPLSREEYAKAQEKVRSRKRFLEDEDDVLTYLALRPQPRSQSLPEDDSQR